jgi:hypothetical protein
VPYALRRLVLGSVATVEISEQEHDALRAAKTFLLDALFIEQKFDLLIENYLETEQELLASTARYMLHGDTDARWFSLERALINRRVVNLLTVCRGYIDHVRGVARRLLDAASAEDLVAEFSRCYDNTLGYRLMEALRNHVQHRGFPIHVLEYSSSLIEDDARNRFRNEVAIYTKTTYLSDGNFKASVLVELESLGGRVDLKPLMRDYVGCLATIHERYRSAIAPPIKERENAFTAATNRFSQSFPAEPSLKGLAAVAIDGANVSDEIYLSVEFLDHRCELESKNRIFANLARRFVSGSTTRKLA